MTMPFVEEEFSFTNPDGRTIQVKGWGNQYYAVFETLDGYTVVKDPKDGFYKYAQLSSDKNDLIPTDAKVDEVDPRSLGLTPHLRIRHDTAKQKAMSAPMRQALQSRWETRRAQKKARARGIMPTASAETRPVADVTVGNYVGLCVLIKFPDVAETIGQQEVDDFCNKQGYTGFGNNGSVRDYFYDVSKGKLTYTNAVTEYHTAQHNRDYYTDPAISYGTRARELIIEVLDHLKSQGVDFGQLSSDSGGYVYALNIFYVGPRVNSWSEGLWPHSWSLASPYDAGGGKKFYDYQFTNMGSQLTLRTFCHENGHMICDYPDLYDYGGESNGVGNYCLMCNGGNSNNPVQVCAYLKNESGWATSLTEITPEITASLTAAQNDFYIYAKNPEEYFIIENRQKTERDTFLPDAGLAIWHVDESGSNGREQMTSAMHYECSLEQCDGGFDMEHNVNYGDSDDLFESTGCSGFSDTTTPNANWWDGSESGLKLSNISESGPTMTFFSGEKSTTFYQIGRTGNTVTDAWQTVPLSSDFDSPPIVLTSIETFDGSDPVGLRIKDVTNSSFYLKLEEEQSKDEETWHTTEVVSFFAVQDGVLRDELGNEIGETGRLSANQTDDTQWHKVDLQNNYCNPVVIMQLMSYQGSQPAHTRIRNVRADSFEYQIEEWDYLDQSHVSEEIGYLVIERRKHHMADGSIIEVGKVETNHEWASVDFDSLFSSSPVTLTHCQTFNGDQAVVTREDQVLPTGFKVRLQEEEANDGIHLVETVGYVAVQPQL